MAQSISRRAMILTGTLGGTALSLAESVAAAPQYVGPGHGLAWIALASAIDDAEIDGSVVALTTGGHTLPGIGAALYVATDGKDDSGAPVIVSRNGRRFRLADDELRAIRPEVLGAIGDCAVAESSAGARFTGHDDSDAFESAIAIALRYAGVVVLSARRYRLTRPLPTITSAMTIAGAGSLKSWLMYDPQASGDALSVAETWMGKDPTEIGPLAKTVAIPDGQSTGVTLSGFTLSGSRASRNRQNGIMFYERNDNVLISDVEVRHIKGRGFCSGISRKPQPTSLLRESRIDRFQIRRCGDRDISVPAFELSSDGYRPADDATNNLTITDLLVIYSSGRGIVMENRASHQDMRYITIHGAYIEGADDDLWTIRGSVTNMEVYGFECNGARNPEAAAITFEASEADAVKRPPRFCYFSGAFGPVSTGIRVRHGKDLAFRITQNGASVSSVTVEAGCTGAVRFEPGGDQRNWKIRVHPSVVHYLTVEPGRKVWSLADLPNPAALVNATIVIRQLADGRAAFARSDGTAWYYTPMEPVPLAGRKA